MKTCIPIPIYFHAYQTHFHTIGMARSPVFKRVQGTCTSKMVFLEACVSAHQDSFKEYTLFREEAT